MSCNTMRILERQRQREEEEAKKKKKAKAKKRITKMQSKRLIKKQAEKFGWIVKDKSKTSMTLTKPNSQDLIEVELMEKNRIKFNVPGVISGMNHANAESLLGSMAEVLNAKVISVVRNVRHAMAHALGYHHHHHHDHA